MASKINNRAHSRVSKRDKIEKSMKKYREQLKQLEREEADDMLAVANEHGIDNAADLAKALDEWESKQNASAAE